MERINKYRTPTIHWTVVLVLCNAPFKLNYSIYFIVVPCFVGSFGWFGGHNAWCLHFRELRHYSVNFVKPLLPICKIPEA